MTNMTEDEKRNSMGPLCCLESQTELLPKNAFRNRFTWICYEIPNLIEFRIWALLFVLLALWWRFSGNLLLPFLFTVCMLLILPCIGILHFPHVKRTISKELDKFSREIIANAPGADVEDWESVASHVNTYLYEKKLWNTKYCIYDGANCFEIFRKHLLDPFTLAHDNSEKLRVLKESIPCGEEALQVYRKEIDKRWKFMTSEKGLSAINLENIKLPRDTCYSKLSWGLKPVIKSPGFIFPTMNFLAELNFPSKFESRLGGAAYAIGCFAFTSYLIYEGFRNRVSVMKLKDKMQFLSAIINEQDWDTVARQMNSYLYEQKAWVSDQFFFDGAECERFFRRHFADVLAKKRSPTSYLNSELWPYIEEALSSFGQEIV